MKTINFRGISETLGEKELKNVVGGIVTSASMATDDEKPENPCAGKSEGSSCTTKSGYQGKCIRMLGGPLHCSDLL